MCREYIESAWKLIQHEHFAKDFSKPHIYFIFVVDYIPQLLLCKIKTYVKTYSVYIQAEWKCFLELL